MLPSAAVLPLVLFMGLILVLSLQGLTAAGHFPREHRAPELCTPMGMLILFGSLAIAVLCFAIGLAVAWMRIPWYAAVIGGGAVVLLAPLVLHSFSDAFVDSRGALVTFSGIAAVLSLLAWFV